jgi:hypothetical protein
MRMREENDKTTTRRARGAERQREGNNRGDTTRVPAIWGKQQQADGAHAFLLRKTREGERGGEEPMKQTNKQAAHRESREVRGGACARFDRIGQAGGHGSDSYRHSYSYSYRMLTYDAYRTRNNGTRETKDGAQQMSLTHSNRPRERGRESAPSSSLSFLFLICISI